MIRGGTESSNMTPEAHARLCKLLPELGALTDAHRLKVLADIDRIFVREGLTWEDVTARLLAPEIDGEEVLSMVAAIMKRPEVISHKAIEFLTQLRTRAAYSDVRLSPAQSTWLLALRDQVAKAEARDAPEKPKPETKPEKTSTNVIKLERSPAGTAH
jgi:hypothetical protein